MNKAAIGVVVKPFSKASYLLMLGWLNSRSDNPRLRKHLKGAIKRALFQNEKLAYLS